jgi:hypothetical protein
MNHRLLTVQLITQLLTAPWFLLITQYPWVEFQLTEIMRIIFFFTFVVRTCCQCLRDSITRWRILLNLVRPTRSYLSRHQWLLYISMACLAFYRIVIHLWVSGIWTATVQPFVDVISIWKGLAIHNHHAWLCFVLSECRPCSCIGIDALCWRYSGFKSQTGAIKVFLFCWIPLPTVMRYN